VAPTDLDLITSVADACAQADGAAPLDEAAWLALRHPEHHTPEVTVAGDAFAVVVDGALSLAVHPRARGRGYGGTLLAEALGRHRGSLAAWAHGDHPAAAALARRHGFARVRELWVLRRPTALPLDDRTAPHGVTIRGYRAEDRDALLRVNAAAFADHPEQGGMDADNLAERMAEDWWDPAGLLVAVGPDGAMLGFHWTKVHSPTLGEIYVLGIAPEGQGRGLGQALAVAGLRHLAARGVREVHLYVEADNAVAVALYTGLGFTHADTDTHVMYRRVT
jgi:mycothiol synthase